MALHKIYVSISGLCEHCMYAGGVKTQLKRRGGSVVKLGAFRLDFRLEGRRFESYASRHVGTLGKSFTHSCL